LNNRLNDYITYDTNILDSFWIKNINNIEEGIKKLIEDAKDEWYADWINDAIE